MRQSPAKYKAGSVTQSPDHKKNFFGMDPRLQKIFGGTVVGLI